MSNVKIKLLERYRIDTADGATADGSTKLAILVLKPNDGPELAVAISREDSIMIAHQLLMAHGAAYEIPIS